MSGEDVCVAVAAAVDAAVGDAVAAGVTDAETPTVNDAVAAEDTVGADVCVAVAAGVDAAVGDAVPDGESEVVAGERGDVPDTVMLAHLKAPAFAVAPSPTIAPQKFALSSAAAGIVLLPDCGDVVIASEKTALEEKLDVALPADE